MPRERLTITLDTDVLAAADSLVNHSTIRNRSHALEHLVREGLGLQLLTQAFLFVDADGWEQAEDVLWLCKQTGIAQLFVCLPSAAAGLRADLEQLIASVGGFESTFIPLDFGSGGAVVLQRTFLQNPFLLVWIGSGLCLPASLTPAYVFHRQQHPLLSQLVWSKDGSTYQPCGLAIAEPALLSQIPAGQVSLEHDVFPALAAAHNLMPYAIIPR